MVETQTPNHPFGVCDQTPAATEWMANRTECPRSSPEGHTCTNNNNRSIWPTNQSQWKICGRAWSGGQVKFRRLRFVSSSNCRHLYYPVPVLHSYLDFNDHHQQQQHRHRVLAKYQPTAIGVEFYLWRQALLSAPNQNNSIWHFIVSATEWMVITSTTASMPELRGN